ncbi:MAG: hypothetical protein RL139_553, partial [Gemmatimonadota bacterium]|jgi:putative methionine-R-sulfoxide reductase with GAF domain
MPPRSLPALALALSAAPGLEAALVALAGAVDDGDRDAQLLFAAFDGRRELLVRQFTARDGRAVAGVLELSLGQFPESIEPAIREGAAFVDVPGEPAAYARLLGLTPGADVTLALRGVKVDGQLAGVVALVEPRRVFGLRAVERVEPLVALFALAVARFTERDARQEAERTVEVVAERVHAEVAARAAASDREQAEAAETARRQARRLTAVEEQLSASVGHLEQAHVELHRRAESLRARTRTLALLERVFAVAAASVDPEALANGLVELLGDDLEASRCSLFLTGGEPRTLVLVAARGLPPGVGVGRIIPFGESVAGKVAERREPLLVTDAVDVKQHHLLLQDDYLNRGSFISFPLEWRGDLLGVVNVSNRVQQGFFVEEDLVRVRLLALVVSVIVAERGLVAALAGGAPHGR